jgi:hypothetical protein
MADDTPPNVDAGRFDVEPGAPVPSIAQDEWTDIAQTVRKALHAKLPAVPAMTIDELAQFVNLCGQSQGIEFEAMSYDETTDIRHERWSRWLNDPKFRG